MHWQKYSAWGAAIVVAAAVASLVTALPAHDAYCTICGAHHETRAVGVRFTAFTFFRLDRVQPTPFSKLLEEKHLVAAHQHRWQQPQLVPDPMDEFGTPVLESLAFISAPRVVNFMRNVADYADPVSVAQWKMLVMQPVYTRVIDGSLRFMQVPAEGFADRTAFLNWWGQNSFAVYNRLREVTEAD